MSCLRPLALPSRKARSRAIARQHDWKFWVVILIHSQKNGVAGQNSLSKRFTEHDSQMQSTNATQFIVVHHCSPQIIVVHSPCTTATATTIKRQREVFQPQKKHKKRQLQGLTHWELLRGWSLRSSGCSASFFLRSKRFCRFGSAPAI